MKNYTSEITLDTKNAIEFVDISGKVLSICKESGIASGIVNVFTRHTTTAIKINEKCERLQKDMCELINAIVPDGDYLHNASTVDGRPNARSHLIAMLLNASETFPLSQGRPEIGTWQSIFFVELDGPRRGRKVVVKIIGE